MSFAALLAVLEARQEPGCTWSRAAFEVLIRLADFKNAQTGQCDPSLDTLGAVTHLERHALLRVLTKLEDEKLIRRPERGKGGRGHRQGYDLLLPEREASGLSLVAVNGEERKGGAGYQKGRRRVQEREASGLPNLERTGKEPPPGQGGRVPSRGKGNRSSRPQPASTGRQAVRAQVDRPRTRGRGALPPPQGHGGGAALVDLANLAARCPKMAAEHDGGHWNGQPQPWWCAWCDPTAENIAVVEASEARRNEPPNRSLAHRGQP